MAVIRNWEVVSVQTDGEEATAILDRWGGRPEKGVAESGERLRRVTTHRS
jgi:hypothetical protein